MTAAGVVAIVGLCAIVFGTGDAFGAWVSCSRSRDGLITAAVGLALMPIALLFAFIEAHV